MCLFSLYLSLYSLSLSPDNVRSVTFTFCQTIAFAEDDQTFFVFVHERTKQYCTVYTVFVYEKKKKRARIARFMSIIRLINTTSLCVITLYAFLFDKPYICFSRLSNIFVFYSIFSFFVNTNSRKQYLCVLASDHWPLIITYISLFFEYSSLLSKTVFTAIR